MPQSAIEVPEVNPSGTIGLAELGTSQPTPFSIVHVAPEGATDGDPAIHVVFSHALRALGPDVPVPQGLIVEPAVPGHWEWVGAFGLTFVPEKGHLPRATAFQVTVPPSIQSVQGKTLKEGRIFEFETPAPRVTSMRPSRWSNYEAPDRHIELSFSQPVTPDAVRKSITVSSQGRESRFRVVKTNSNTDLKLIPETGWPTDSKIEVNVSSGWRGSEGPVSARDHFKSHFRTYGPLRAQLQCSKNKKGECDPEGGLSLELSNPVNARALSKAISGSGARLQVDREWSESARTRYISIATDLVPGSRISVRLGPIKDIFGQPLSIFDQRTVTIGDYSPRVRIGFWGDSIGPEHKKIAVTSMNTEYELVSAPLTPEQLVEMAALNSDDRFAKLVTLNGAKRQTVSKGTLNRKKVTWLELDEITSKGPFAVGARYKEEGHNNAQVRWGQRTDLTVTAKRGRDAAHVWVTRLATGAPIRGATVKVLGHVSESTTNSNGLATLPEGLFRSKPGNKKNVEWLEVRAGEERAYRSTLDSVNEWRIPVYTDFYGSPRDVAYLFPERDLFRPGEKGWIKGYLRRPAKAGNRVVEGEQLELKLKSPDSEEIASYPIKTNAYGAFSAQVEIPATARLGYFNAILMRGKEHLTSTYLQVAEYRPAEFEVKTQALKPEVIAKEDVTWSVQGNYFFGGVMKEAPVDYTISRRRTSFTPPGFDEYVSDDWAWQSDEPYTYIDPFLKSDDTSLNKTGDTEISFNSTLKDQVGPERLELEASVRDLSGQVQSARSSALVHPASFYLAIKRPESTFFDAPGTIEPQVRAVSPRGVSVAGKNIDLSLHRIRWTHVTRKNGSNARETIRELVRERKARCSFSSKTTDAGCQLKLQEAGLYVLRASAKDRAGRQVFASNFFYAIGEHGTSSWRDDDERGEVKLEADRKEYRVGQTARILVQSPFSQARAWVTVEREGVMTQKVVRVSGPSPVIKIPITEDMRPNAYVSVHLLEDRRAMGRLAHDIGDSARFGYTNLRIDPERQRLSVNIKADKKEYRPGSRVKLDLKVLDTHQRASKAEVTVFVVDEGVLSLSGFELPDPLSAFTGQRALRVETIEGRDRIAHVLSPSDVQNESKGDPGGGGEGERSEILTTAYFNPSIITDKNGRASVEFDLPDNLGRFRVMALAASKDDRYGRGSSALVVNKRLMVRPALPRFLRAGDRFEASAVINVLGEADGDVSVSIEGDGIDWLGERRSTVNLEKGGAGVVRFPARVTKVGPVRFRFRVKGAGVSDAIRLTRSVQSPAQLEAVALYGQTQSAVAHQLGDLSLVRRDMGSFQVTMSSSALVGLEGGFEQLWSYPYLCSEQLSSRILPLVSLRDLARLYGVDIPKDADKRVADAVAQLVRRQRSDGGFGMWPESQDSNPWVSSYALWALHEADRRGAIVPKSVFERGLRFLEKVAAKRDEDDLPPAVFATFIAGRIGKADPATIHALIESLEQMPVESRLMLLSAAAEAELSELVEPLKKRAEGSITLRGNRAEVADPHADRMVAYMGSRTRRHAITLSALLAADPQHRLAAPLVRALLDARQGLGWGSTQEAAFALFALDEYRRAQEKEEPDFESLAFFGEKLLGRRTFLGRELEPQEFSMPIATLNGGQAVTFQRKGQAGTLFFEARLKYARKELPTAPHEAGFLVEKTMMPVTRDELRSRDLKLEDSNNAKHGQLVLVNLKVLVPTRRRFVVVDDPLPAGLEAVDSSLATTANSLSTASGSSAGYQRAWHRRELRDDRVLYFVDDMPPGVYRYRHLARATTAGLFVTPPTKAMEMYQEEIFGRTAARKFGVQ